ncbi:MAG: FHA domain-containing protein [Myxococcales bacterium]|nr:FHA domain-containing protein [Myxococcales bacterium]
MSESKRLTARLVAADDQGRRIELPLREGPNRIGRAPHCEIQFDDPECSREHALVTVADGRISVRDLGSENATFLNHHPLGTADEAAAAGDELIVGVIALTFEWFAPPVDDSATMVNAMQARRRPRGADDEPDRPRPAELDETRLLRPEEVALEPGRRQRLARFPFIEVFGESAGARRFLMRQAAFTIGRAPDNHLALVDKLVSGHHAVIRHTAEGYVIEDLGSRNGLFVNNQKVQRHRLTPNLDTILVGDTRLRFSLPRE